MDYLMILLREYEKNRRTRKKFSYGNYSNIKNNRFIIISKEYWFIDWLVKNDKLKNDGIKPRTDLVKDIQILDYKTGKVLWWKNKYSETEQLIMYLSIQDNPIEYLCSILK